MVVCFIGNPYNNTDNDEEADWDELFDLPLNIIDIDNPVEDNGGAPYGGEWDQESGSVYSAGYDDADYIPDDEESSYTGSMASFYSDDLEEGSSYDSEAGPPIFTTGSNTEDSDEVEGEEDVDWSNSSESSEEWDTISDSEPTVLHQDTEYIVVDDEDDDEEEEDNVDIENVEPEGETTDKQVPQEKMATDATTIESSVPESSTTHDSTIQPENMSRVNQ